MIMLHIFSIVINFFNAFSGKIWKIIIIIIIIKFEKKDTLPKLSQQKTVNECKTKKQMRNILIVDTDLVLTLSQQFLLAQVIYSEESPDTNENFSLECTDCWWNIINLCLKQSWKIIDGFTRIPN